MQVRIKKLKNKIFIYTLFAVIFGLLGYFREYFFVNVNSLMYNKFYNDNYTIPGFFYFLFDCSFNTLYYLKYLFTAAFFFIFYFISRVCLRYVSTEHSLLKWLNLAYTVLLAASGIAMLWAYFVKLDLGDDEYTFSRWLMGIAQSPLPLLFILAANRLNRNMK